jgi:hypothetical protein
MSEYKALYPTLEQARSAGLAGMAALHDPHDVCQKQEQQDKQQQHNWQPLQHIASQQLQPHELQQVVTLNNLLLQQQHLFLQQKHLLLQQQHLLLQQQPQQVSNPSLSPPQPAGNAAAASVLGAFLGECLKGARHCADSSSSSSLLSRANKK